MPFKSQAQRRKFAALLVEGKISPDTFEEWNRETGGKVLPERVSRARKTAKTRTRKTAKSRRVKKAKRAKASSRKRARR
jgi:hypothetical protein